MNLLYNAGISLYGLGMRIAALRSDKVRRLLKRAARSVAVSSSTLLTATMAIYGFTPLRWERV